MEINVFCLFGKMVKLHLLVSPYRCVPSVAVTWDYSYRLPLKVARTQEKPTQGLQ